MSLKWFCVVPHAITSNYMHGLFQQSFPEMIWLLFIKYTKQNVYVHTWEYGHWLYISSK